MFFPVFRRILRAIGLDPHVFSTFEEQLLDYMEGAFPSAAQFKVINDAFTLLMMETGVAQRHFISKSEFGIPRVAPHGVEAQCISRLRQATLAGDYALRGRHEDRMSGATAGRVAPRPSAARSPPPKSSTSKAKAGAAAAPPS